MAEFDVLRLPRELVIRPSGIWNSRAPFHNFLALFKIEGRAFAITTMCYERIDAELLLAREQGKTLEEFLVTQTNHRSRRAWNSYVRNQTERNLEGIIKGPIYSNARHDLVVGHDLLRRSTVIATLSLFESYIQCWLLNYLLIKLERQEKWLEEEAKFALQLSPVHGKNRDPNLADILKITHLRDTLKSLDQNGDSFAEEGTALSQFSCFDSVSFWRQYRNGLVHNRGFCTPKLFEKQELFWKICMGQYARDEFGERKRLPLSTELLQNCLTIVYKSARALESTLFRLSEGRRGHPFAPDPIPQKGTVPPQYANKLLVNGDHDLSLRWHINAEFREQFKLVYRTRGDLDQAIEFYQKALKQDEDLDSKEGMAIDYGNLGLVYYKLLGNKTEAKRYYLMSIDLFKQLDSPNTKTVQAWLALCK